MSRLVTALVFTALLAGCAASPSTPGTMTVTLPPSLRSAEVIIVGELHGTNEMPRVAGDLVAQLATMGPVALALEIPRDMDRDLRAYVASDGSPAARETLLQAPFWHRPAAGQDGRSSGAMLALIERVRALRAGGANVRIAAFDVVSSSTLGKSRERTLADQATSEMRAGEVLVVLVGNAHAIRIPAEATPGTEDKMAKMMPQPLVALVARHRGGGYWGCAPDCGPQQTPAKYEDASRDGRIDMRRADGYDGEIFVGPITASPPAVPR